MTPREIEVARVLATYVRLNMLEVAKMLHICIGTLKNHARRVYAKLQVRSRHQLAVYYRQPAFRAGAGL